MLTPPVETVGVRARRRRRGLLGTSGAAVLVLVGGIAAVVGHDDSEQPGLTGPSVTTTVGSSKGPTSTVSPMSPQKGPTSEGTVPSSAGPDVPIVVRDGSSLLVPGGRRFEIGPGHGLSAAPDGGSVAYVTSGGHVRVLRISSAEVYDLGAGSAVVWGPGGLAYVVGHGDSGSLVVRRDGLGAPTTWGKGDLTPTAWAGERVIAYARRDLGDHAYTLDLIVLDRPQRSRRLVDDDAIRHQELVAVSPDASRVLVHVDVEEGGYSTPHLRLYDVVSGRLEIEVHGQGFESLALGVWTAQGVFAPEGYTDGGSTHPAPVLHHLQVSDGNVEQVGSRNTFSGSAENYPSTAILLVADVDGSRLAVVRGNGPTRVLLECEKADLSCREVRRLA